MRDDRWWRAEIETKERIGYVFLHFAFLHSPAGIVVVVVAAALVVMLWHTICARTMSFILMDEKFKCLEDLPSHFSSAFMFYEAANSFFVVASRLAVPRCASTDNSLFYSLDWSVFGNGYGWWCLFVCKWINWVKDVDVDDDQIVFSDCLDRRPADITCPLPSSLCACTSMTCIIYSDVKKNHTNSDRNYPRAKIRHSSLISIQTFN